MSVAGRSAPTSPLRLSFGVATLTLAIAILVGLKAPQDGTIESGLSGGGPSGATGGGTSGGAGETHGGTSAGSSGGSSSTTRPTGSGPAATNSAGPATIDGSVVDTRYGPVEVEITVAGGRITGATAIELPSGGRSGAISNYAAPILSSEALSAQSAQIDLVSGATYTSDAYARSLQSALDQAGL
jgi:uncharacterized protein with FMN-binding domain